ncbi:MAG: PolC-type DNA polymerase III [Bacilli bacterium]|nr:PolC-type DNA polymerase III [Bacilli bacterium]
MDKKLEALLEHIGIDEDNIDYFKNAKIDKVIINKNTGNLVFNINIDVIPPYRVYKDLYESLKKEFTNKISLLFISDNYANVGSYINNIIDEYSKNSIRYNVFKNRDIDINKNKITYKVFNKIEEMNIKNIEKDIVKKLNTYSFKELIFNIQLEESVNEEIIKEIEADKAVKPIQYKEKESIKEEIKGNRKYYRPKKSREITKLKDLLYEVDNINIEVEVFDIDIFEAKSGYKIFTLKVTDYTDSIYCKIFTKDADEADRIKKALKKKNWYQMYGKVKEDNFSNGELTFMTRFRDIIEIDSKLDWIKTDNNPEKRVELHAHTMMSQMDGVIDEIKLIKQAIKWGHSGIAITDHDGCQAFPHVFNEVTNHNKKILAPFKDKIKELEEKKNDIDKDNICDIKLIDDEIETIKKEMVSAPTFRAMYGTELEMSNDTLDIVINPNDNNLYNSTYVIFDTETTGFNPGLHDSMIEIGAVKMKDGAIIESFDELINPGVLIDSEITELTGIDNRMVKDCPNEEIVTKKFKEWIGDLPLVAHNATFDVNMLESAYHKYNLGKLENPVLDTLIISQIINKDLKRHNLSALTKNYGLTFEESDGTESGHHHRADYDAEFTGYIFFKMLKQLDKDKIKTLNDLSKLPDEFEINKWNREVHVNMIAKTRVGLKNMFKIVSYAATKYLVKSPRIPKHIIRENREDLLIGSGCYNGEIFNIALTRHEEDLKKAMEFYDYIEVQPISNYSHLVARHDINSIEEVKYAIEKIVKCAKEINKLVVATSDCHTLTKEDKIYREIIVHQNVPGKGRHPLARYLNLKGYDTIPDQYFRTTEEMLGEFSFLDKDTCHEIVIENTNKIRNMCEDYEVIIDTGGIPFSPKINNSIKTVIDMVYDKAKNWYGEVLPHGIEERIAKELYGDSVLKSIKNQLIKEKKFNDKELEEASFKKLHEVIFAGDEEVRKIVGENIKDSSSKKLSSDELNKLINKSLGGIIGGGFDVIYLIAQKLVKHSNNEGFLVGSRGSVGSSFVATMMGITEVNPLPAHYRCPKCKHSLFNDDDGKALGATYSSGFDLPDKVCPKCGENMIKDGQDMPFATFLGFNADKVPDIDLNFSDLNQASAHNYTKVLFGEDNVYRAGTIGTVAEKTAFGFVKGFIEDRGLKMRTAEVERIANGCTGVKRTTGQHPGGIVVIPGYMDVFDFTPFQYPADDATSAWRTTHFDYHAIDQDVLKLDILGHTDPTQLRLIQNIRGVPVAEDVPLDDKKTMGIFLSPEPLGVTKEQIMNETGTLGIPEFGTPFTIGMLIDTKPKTFAELIKISGLSHGTDVWLGNAQELIRSGKVEFKDVIGCRDDIMVYLMYHGVEPLKAFKIMEFVRKGKASKEPKTWKNHVKIMEKAGIEDWFINSCAKIKYMFPKAHAAAYVISAFRIAYYKVHYPIIYYATYFSTRFADFDITCMIKGYNSIKSRIIDINNKGYDITNKEASILETLKLALEATARGIIFGNLDIMKSDAKNFIIADDGITLIPPFRTIDGLGDTVAQSIMEEAKKKPFISIEDFQKRCHVSTTLVDKMKNMNLFEGMPESNQLSLF